MFRKDGGTLRQMTGDKLLKTLPHLQAQIDSLLEFDCSSQVGCSTHVLLHRAPHPKGEADTKIFPWKIDSISVGTLKAYFIFTKTFSKLDKVLLKLK